MGVLKGDTRSLDYSSCSQRLPLNMSRPALTIEPPYRWLVQCMTTRSSCKVITRTVLGRVCNPNLLVLSRKKGTTIPL